MNITVRLLEEKEIPQLAEVFMRSFNASAFEEKWTQETAEVFLNHFFKKQPDLFFVAVADSKIVGGAVTEITPYWFGNMMEKSELFVDPDFQNKGVSKKLLQTLLSESIKKYQATVFSGITTTKAEFPLSWYKKIGMKETDLVYIEGKPEEVLKKLEE